MNQSNGECIWDRGEGVIALIIWEEKQWQCSVITVFFCTMCVIGLWPPATEALTIP